MLTLNDEGVARNVVLRVDDARGAGPVRSEKVALELAGAQGVPVPRPIAADFDHDPPLLLVEAVEGTSLIPVERPPARLKALGAAAAAVHRVALQAHPDLPARDRPLVT
jgi:tRNA A-37 threonylcarbamoyl transferase component Bud32